MENEERRTFLQIDSFRLVNIRVILDGENVYEGEAEKVPEAIGKLKYSKIENADKTVLYVYGELQ